MKTSDFDFELPEELIAQFPTPVRGESRLMIANPAVPSLAHGHIRDLPNWVAPGTVVVLNDTKVRKARIFGSPVVPGGAGEELRRRQADGASGGTALVEFLLIEQLPGFEGRRWRAMCSRPRRQPIGKGFAFADGTRAEIVGAEGEYRLLSFDPPIDDSWLERCGHVPLPPYIKRADASLDSERYQTVYADRTGSIAAPTAGLHLTQGVLAALEGVGAEVVRITLHVGIGTFLPIRVERVEDHVMHEEEYEVLAESAERINRARAQGHLILAVGTTSVRTLESSFREGRVREGRGRTGLFIYPGYRFSVVDQLLTNFHTPGSSLLLLVSAFAGREFILSAYETAIREGYRFFSYGDAMLLTCRGKDISERKVQ